MRSLFLIIFSLLFTIHIVKSQDLTLDLSTKKHGVVWSAGIFKSWLNDEYVGFNKVGNHITPIFSEKYKMGFAIQSHYMYKPLSWLGLGIHLGLGLDVNSYITAPVLLFGGSMSFGNNHQFIIYFGLADGKKRKIPGVIRDQILNISYTEIPIIYDNTELNSGFYLGIGYRIF